MEKGHLVAGCAVTFSQACGACRWRIGSDEGRREGEVDLVFCESAVAGAVVETAGWLGFGARCGCGLGRHLGEGHQSRCVEWI
jgi:hypothetical protein